MEGCMPENSPPLAEENEKTTNAESAKNFQRFVYDLFEKNGILNDLRAYLRGHIVDVLKNAQTGEPPTCQKNFTQRLDLANQALNMLIAEYLLRQEFSYSLSVFVSEIPLANMVFDFAKQLMQNTNGDFADLRFKENDIWAILNYLGVECDSEHASRIVEVYNDKENMSLLFCILKCVPMFHRDGEAGFEYRASSSDSLSCSSRSLNYEKQPKAASNQAFKTEKCRHYVFCGSCRAKMTGIKEKYITKKKHLIKNMKSDLTPINVETLMRNMSVMERSLIDEMFQQLKGVYEAEVEMLKQEEDSKVKRTLAAHAARLQKQRDEMEESFKAREEELSRSVQEKKKFLWGLARTLRDQHASMARAMHAVRGEAGRLTAKEESLKSQLTEAEDVLRNRGEEMRKQISDELIILEGHLESMKRERDSINRERAELDCLKQTCNSSSTMVHDLNNQELRSHYDLLKDELGILKKYLETAKLEPKCVMERGTLTDLSNVSSKIQIVLNNEQNVDRSPQDADREDRRTPNKVVNVLKKRKNVNFSSSNIEDYRESVRSRSLSRSTISTEAEDIVDRNVREYDLIERLREENERLNTFVRQQRDHIDELTCHGARLQSQLTCSRLQQDIPPRPTTAPTVMPRDPRYRSTQSISPVGWQKGAGEEMTMFSNAQSRILLPGDELPFIGFLRDRHNDNRRHLINQWRALRRRVSPGKPRPLGPQATPLQPSAGTAISGIHSFGSPSVEEAINSSHAMNRAVEQAKESLHPMNKPFTFPAEPRDTPKITTINQLSRETHKLREKSPKSVLKEAKEKLKNKSHVKEAPSSSGRDKSPTGLLREAKLRLRKLEIEAEAVRDAYSRYRGRRGPAAFDNKPLPSLDIPTISNPKVEEIYRMENFPHHITRDVDSTKRDFQKYLCEYQTNTNIANFKTKPITEVYSKTEAVDEQLGTRENYLETPLIEFRKLYSLKSPIPSIPVSLPTIEHRDLITEVEVALNNAKEILEPQNVIRHVRSKKEELEILKNNINKMYNLQDHSEIEQKIVGAFVEDSSSEGKLGEVLLIAMEEHREENLPTLLGDLKDGNLIASKDEMRRDYMDSIEKIMEDKAPTDELRSENVITPIDELGEKSLIVDEIKTNAIDEFKECLAPTETLMNENTIAPTDNHSLDEQRTSPTAQEVGNLVIHNDEVTENLTVEVETVSKSDSLKVSDTNAKEELLLVVESLVDEVEVKASSELEETPHTTVEVTPRRDSNGVDNGVKSAASASPQREMLLRDDALDTILDAKQSNLEEELVTSKDSVPSGSENVEFSAYSDRSPSDRSSISLPKNSDDDNFWN